MSEFEEISNPNEIYKGDFDKMVTLKGLEIFTKSAVDSYYNQFGDILQKSEENELTDEDKSKMDVIKSEINSLQMWEVLDDNFKKSILFTREKQVDLQKGIYLDTVLNKKLNRIGKEIKILKK